MVLYTPIGFAAEARTLLPELAEKGRRHLDTRVMVARMIGKLAVAKGQVELRQTVQRLREQAAARQAAEEAAAAERRRSASIAAPAAPRTAPGVADPEAGTEVMVPVRLDEAPRDRAAGDRAAGDRAAGDRAAGDRAAGDRQGAAPGGVVDGPAVTSLAIPDYDALAASQVVPRLPSLTADELDAVRRYEEAHRARRTVLARIAQLQAP